jgi:hypothetical protein
VVINGGRIESIEEKKSLFARDLICFLNNSENKNILDYLLREILNCPYFSLTDLKDHLLFVLNHFEDIADSSQMHIQIRNCTNKMMIIDITKNIYKSISKRSLTSDRGIPILTS